MDYACFDYILKCNNIDDGWGYLFKYELIYGLYDNIRAIMRCKLHINVSQLGITICMLISL